MLLAVGEEGDDRTAPVTVLLDGHCCGILDEEHASVFGTGPERTPVFCRRERDDVLGVILVGSGSQAVDVVFFPSRRGDAHVAFVVANHNGLEFIVKIKAFDVVVFQSVGVGRSLREVH